MYEKRKGPAPTPTLNNEIEPGMLLQQHSKDTYFLAQKKRVFKAFFGTPKTMLEVEALTGVMRSNITWYVDEWMKTKSIQRVKTGYCSITKRKAGRYSTNPNHWKEGAKNEG